MSKESALAAATGSQVQAQPTLPTQTTPPQAQSNPSTQEAQPAPSDRFAQLSAKEIKLQKEREQVKAELAAINADKTKLAEYKKTIDEFEELKKTDKIAALKKIGFTEEDIFNFMAGKEDPKPPTPEEIAAKAAEEATQKLRDEMKAESEKLAKERDERNIKAFKDGIGETITKEADKYEYLNHYGPIAQEIVYETILGYMKEDPELTPLDAMKEALEAVENYYEEEFTSMMNLKKIQAKIKPQAPVAETKVEPARKTVVQSKPEAPKPPPRPSPTPQATPIKETPQQKRERLENALRNMGKVV